jgi:hypothetical protein
MTAQSALLPGQKSLVKNGGSKTVVFSRFPVNNQSQNFQSTEGISGRSGIAAFALAQASPGLAFTFS